MGFYPIPIFKAQNQNIFCSGFLVPSRKNPNEVIINIIQFLKFSKSAKGLSHGRKIVQIWKVNKGTSIVDVKFCNYFSFQIRTLPSWS